MCAYKTSGGLVRVRLSSIVGVSFKDLLHRRSLDYRHNHVKPSHYPTSKIQEYTLFNTELYLSR